MPLPLAELKGRAVRHMNSEPVIALARGHTLPRNFVVEVERAWGFPALRFGEKVHLLAVPGRAPGLLAGEDSYVVVSRAEVDPVRQRLIGEPEAPVTIEGVFPLPEEAIAHAANIAAGWEFMRRAIEGDYEPKDRVAVEQEDESDDPVESPEIEAARAAIDPEIFDSCAEEAPENAMLRPLVDLFRLVHGRHPRSASYWPDFQITRVENAGQSALRIGDEYDIFRLAEVPAREFVEQEDVSGAMQPGIVVTMTNRRAADGRLGAWSPALPLARRHLVSIHTSWGYAVMKACGEWLSLRMMADLRDAMGNHDSDSQ